MRNFYRTHPSYTRVREILLVTCLTTIQCSLREFGTSVGHLTTPLLDSGSSPAIPIDPPFGYYGSLYNTVYVNNDGSVSFAAPSDYQDTTTVTGSVAAVCGFCSDIDITKSGTVWYGITTSLSERQIIADDVRIYDEFPSDYLPSWVIVVTWDAVASYLDEDGKVNTFQVIIATDGTRSVVQLLYGAITWVEDTIDYSQYYDDEEPPEIRAQCGFLAGDRVNSYLLSASRSESLLNISEMSNVGVPGRFVFRVDQDIVSPTTKSETELSSSPAAATDINSSQSSTSSSHTETPSLQTNTIFGTEFSVHTSREPSQEFPSAESSIQTDGTSMLEPTVQSVMSISPTFHTSQTRSTETSMTEVLSSVSVGGHLSSKITESPVLSSSFLTSSSLFAPSPSSSSSSSSQPPTLSSSSTSFSSSDSASPFSSYLSLVPTQSSTISSMTSLSSSLSVQYPSVMSIYSNLMSSSLSSSSSPPVESDSTLLPSQPPLSSSTIPFSTFTSSSSAISLTSTPMLLIISSSSSFKLASGSDQTYEDITIGSLSIPSMVVQDETEKITSSSAHGVVNTYTPGLGVTASSSVMQGTGYYSTNTAYLDDDQLSDSSQMSTGVDLTSPESTLVLKVSVSDDASIIEMYSTPTTSSSQSYASPSTSSLSPSSTSSSSTSDSLSPSLTSLSPSSTSLTPSSTSLSSSSTSLSPSSNSLSSLTSSSSFLSPFFAPMGSTAPVNEDRTELKSSTSEIKTWITQMTPIAVEIRTTSIEITMSTTDVHMSSVSSTENDNTPNQNPNPGSCQGISGNVRTQRPLTTTAKAPAKAESTTGSSSDGDGVGTGGDQDQVLGFPFIPMTPVNSALSQHMLVIFLATIILVTIGIIQTVLWWRLIRELNTRERLRKRRRRVRKQDVPLKIVTSGPAQYQSDHMYLSSRW